MMKTFIIEGILFDLCSLEAIEVANFYSSMKEAKKGIEAYKCLDYDSEESHKLYNELHKILSDNLDRAYFDERFKAFYEECYSDYFRLESIEQLKYRLRYEAEFLEYASHKNEPDFDWGFYSDWHKDIYGYRPRW